MSNNIWGAPNLRDILSDTLPWIWRGYARVIFRRLSRLCRSCHRRYMHGLSCPWHMR